MKKILKVLILFALTRLCTTACANGDSFRKAEESGELSSELYSTPIVPIKIASAKGFRWAEYCPDETCEVLRVPARVSAESLSGIALVYFYYVGKYEYLQTWRDRDDLRSKLEKFVQLSRTTACNDASSRLLALCVLRNFHKSFGLELLFIRYDERKSTTLKLDVDEQLKD